MLIIIFPKDLQNINYRPSNHLRSDGIALICGVSALCGYVIFDHFSPGVIAATTAVAAGAILSMLSDTMIPEAFEATLDYAGIVTVLGVLAAFNLAKIAM